MNEQVLVIKEKVLKPHLDKFVGGLYEFPPQEVVNSLVGDEPFYMDRATAETDPTHKQFIPYCIIFNKNNMEEAYFYQRTKMAGEQRLHGKWSIGIGGHINPCDGEVTKEPYFAGLKRELLEEIGYNLTCECDAPVVGLLYDESNEVGQVHLGFVHALKLEPGQIQSYDPSILNGKFIKISDMAGRTNLENWSKILVDKINEP